MLNKDERDGKVTEVKGHIKQAVGAVTGNAHLKTEGKIDEVKGKVQATVGEARHKFGDALKDVGAAIKK